MIQPVLLALATILVGPSPEPEDTTPYVVVYPIRDLMVALPNFDQPPEMDLNAALTQQGTLFRTNTKRETAPQDPREIIDLIERVVEPDAWGNTATIRYWNGTLIVNAPKRIHEMLN